MRRLLRPNANRRWPRKRLAAAHDLSDLSLHPHETSVPGLFAVGDVRAGSVKRVASAVGEGAVVVSEVHVHLSTPHG